MTQQRTRQGDFDDLAADYERYRIGYSADLFDLLETFGIRRGASVLDAGCGTGLSAQPLVARGISVTGVDPSADMLEAAKRRVPAATFVASSVETLPFADGFFDAAICAQAFHWFDAAAAFRTLIRVVKPGGAVAVWWKILGTDEPLRALRATAAKHAGVEPTPDPMRGGFGAFYQAPFAGRTLRVLPFVARLCVDDWIGYERSRAAARNGYGDKRETYVAALRAGLIEKHGAGDAPLDVRYTQFLYVGQTAG